MTTIKEREISDELRLAMINAAKDIAIAKINAKGKGFDGYVSRVNWFESALRDVVDGYQHVIEKRK